MALLLSTLMTSKCFQNHDNYKIILNRFLHNFKINPQKPSAASAYSGFNHWNNWDTLSPKMGFRLILQKCMVFQSVLYPYISKSCRLFWVCAITTHTLSLILPILLPQFTNSFGKQSLGLGAKYNKLLLIPFKLH